MLVLSPTLLICLVGVGLTEADMCSSSSMSIGFIVCPQPEDPGHFTRCCGPEWARQCCYRQGYWGDYAYYYYGEVQGLEREDDYFQVGNSNEEFNDGFKRGTGNGNKEFIEGFKRGTGNGNKEFIEGFKKGTVKSMTNDDEVVHLPPKPVTSKEDSLSGTKSVLQNEKYLYGFIIEISVVIMMVVVMCIICSIPMIIKTKTRGGVIHAQADQEGQQVEFHHQEADLHQGVVRPYSARTYRPRSVCPPHLLPRGGLDPPPTYPGPDSVGDAVYQQLISQLMADTEDVDDYLPSYDEAINGYMNDDVDCSQN